ncbi:MAG TPA: hypothetical protein ACHBX6_13430 [Arsenophonus nasoniae]|uniref:hypothetical protein n=1 Tax=Arsenophonus nasoniae TaxID=638 RepID=UPI00387985BD
MFKKTAICIASGPSLLPQDVGLIKNYTKIAVNLSYKLSKNCDYLVAGDYKFWLHHFDEIKKETSAQLFTRSKLAAAKYNLNLLDNCNRTVCNSGQLAIELAMTLKPEKIILLGYDCSIKNGLHFHGKHIKELDNPTENLTKKWQQDFKELADEIDIKIVNCSRYTELDCFPRNTLQSELQSDY